MSIPFLYLQMGDIWALLLQVTNYTFSIKIILRRCGHLKLSITI